MIVTYDCDPKSLLMVMTLDEPHQLAWKAKPGTLVIGLDMDTYDWIDVGIVIENVDDKRLTVLWS